jgi:hypothetical protein
MPVTVKYATRKSVDIGDNSIYALNHQYAGTVQGRGWELTIFDSKPLVLLLMT